MQDIPQSRHWSCGIESQGLWVDGQGLYANNSKFEPPISIYLVSQRETELRLNDKLRADDYTIESSHPP